MRSNLKNIAIALAIVVCLVALLDRVRVEVPKQKKLVDCKTNPLRFEMTCDYWPPYQFVLGLPHSATGHFSFLGKVIVSQSTGNVARIPIGSQDVTPCNWLHDDPRLAGYILEISRTNSGMALSELLTHGQSYDVQVIFDELPPSESSLWLSSVAKVGFFRK